MSNRLIHIGRIPLIPDPSVAVKAGQALSSTQAQTDRVVEMGEAFGTLLSNIGGGIRRFGDLLDRAVQIRNLSIMSDKSLADIGFRREQLPQLYIGSGFDNMVGPRRSLWMSDSER